MERDLYNSGLPAKEVQNNLLKSLKAFNSFAFSLPDSIPPPHTHLCVPSCCHAGMIWLVYVAFYPEINHISFYYKCATVRPGAGDCTAALIILSPVLRPQRVAESCDNNCRHAVLFKRAFRRKVIYTDMATRNHLLLVLLP